LIAGTDAALYIVFNRYAAIFFFLISIFSFVVFLPIYATGFPQDKKDITDKDNDLIVIAFLTSINITGYPSKQGVIFSLIFLLYTGGAFTLMYFYWQKSMSWRYREHKHGENF